MNIKREMIVIALRILSEKTGTSTQPDAFEALMANIFGTETREQRLARELDQASDLMIEKAKTLNTRRKFKKITQNIGM